ncbi:hypothetical protein CHRYSEOSP005_03870 [Chryseobacterium sp. Alg-005]|uniref:GNAT family N-acetyltransferase n=1 Tax=Chryseobacterium sp. Alg-005 TaxID=3159516 RepID=UPI003555B795
MKHWFKFAEKEDWKNIVSKTYRLDIKTMNVQGNTVNLYGNGSLYSNSPYITDGGSFDFGKPLSKNDFGTIDKPILIKTRSKIEVSNDFDHVLVQDYFTYLLDLSQGEDFVWNNKVKSKTRNQVRKAEKLDYTVKTGKTELLDDFYKVISTAWRDLGTPTHSKDFYKNIVEGFTKESGYNAEFMIMYLNKEPVSVACLIYDDHAIHHPYAATLKEYNKHSLNNALYWNIIRFAIRKNIQFFDLGRSRNDQGTAIYKLSWGAEPVQLYYYYFNKTTHKNDEDGKLVNFLIDMWKKLPLSLANFMGPKIIYKVLK